MRTNLFPLTIVCFSLLVIGSSASLNSNPKLKPAAMRQSPGTRCTRLMFGPQQKRKRGRKTNSDSGMGLPGTRCPRLFAGGREGTVLPNSPPNVGLASSTAYIATSANTEVNLKAIACDPDRDTLLYTYSTTGGRIQGNGPTVVWNLTGAPRPGTYTVSVQVDDGCGCISFDSAAVKLE